MAAGDFFQQSPYDSQIGEVASCPFSFPSEPPDIGNWFSSYEYESPESSDFFRGLEDESKEIFAKVQGKDCPIPPEEEKLVENGNPPFSVENSQNEYLLESGSSTPEGKRDLLFEEDLVLNNKIQPNELSSSLNYDDMLNTSNGNHGDLNHVNNQITITQEQECEDQDTYLENRSWVSLNSPPHEGTSNGEQIENASVMPENGFISTRSRDGSNRNAEMSVNGNKGSSFEQQEKMRVCIKDQPISVRRAMVDKTNVYFSEEANVAETPGKWKCPRASKPYAGPPLKQLRMERWVRRLL